MILEPGARVAIVLLVAALVAFFAGVHVLLEVVGGIVVANVVLGVLRGFYYGTRGECPGCPGCYCDGEVFTGPGHHEPGEGAP